jgi:hypothetical protein
MKKSSDTIGNRTRDLPVRSAVPQPLRHRVPPTIVECNKTCAVSVCLSQLSFVSLFQTLATSFGLNILCGPVCLSFYKYWSNDDLMMA